VLASKFLLPVEEVERRDVIEVVGGKDANMTVARGDDDEVPVNERNAAGDETRVWGAKVDNSRC
jgi:hypothetical protein